MRHQKMISLDGETLKIAEQMPNFSAWVRAQLLTFNEKQNPGKIWSYYCVNCDNEIYRQTEDNYYYCPKWETCGNTNTLTPRELIQ